jgi:hypothetical protein
MGMRLSRLILILLVLATTGQASERLMLIRVEQGSSAWSDSRIYQKLALSLTRDANLQIEPAVQKEPLDVPFPNDPLDERSVADWAQQYRAQFVMVVIIHNERLEKRKTFNIPLVFHKYETWGVIEGELRLVDVAKGKQVRAVPFLIEQVGRRTLQATMDDDINDPDLRLTAPDKIQFFSRLEDKLVTHLVEQVRGPIGRYDREYVSQPQAKK